MSQAHLKTGGSDILKVTKSVITTLFEFMQTYLSMRSKGIQIIVFK